jgi:hypothetical protein
MARANPRLGYHYYPDDHHFTLEDLRRWTPVLAELGASWLTVRAGLRRAIPEGFLRGLLEAGVEPIVHMPLQIGSLRPPDLSPMFEIYARWGVRYVVLFDRPNMRIGWESSDWGRQGLVERFVDHLLPFLLAQQTAGLSPVFPPLEPGGDYWDTSFLETALRSIKRRGKQSILHDLTLGVYAWADGKSLDWGSGGPQRWPDAHPYYTPPGCQDHRGLHIADWYAAISEAAIEHVAPMITIAGDARTKGSESKSALGPDPLGETTVAVARMLEGGRIHRALQNFNFYLLASEDGDRDLAWFPGPDAPRAVVSHMRDYVASLPSQPSLGEGKPLEHYVLLGAPLAANFRKSWSTLGDLVYSAKPVVGFSSQEARYARKVTVAAGSDVIPERTLRGLREAGCEVQRLPRPILNGITNGTFPDSGNPT